MLSLEIHLVLQLERTPADANNSIVLCLKDMDFKHSAEGITFSLFKPWLLFSFK